MSTTEQEAGRAILPSICKITAALAEQGIAKDGKNTQQNYRFRGIEQVYAALAPLLVEHQVTIVPVVEERIESERKTSKGGAIYSVAMRVRFILTSAIDGSQTEATVWGEGMDSGDKATNKAMSAAYKYMAFMTFCVPVDGMTDSESDARTRSAARPAKVQLQPYDVVEQAISEIEQAPTPAALNAIGKRVGVSKFGPNDMEQAKDAYQKRQEELGIIRTPKKQEA